MHKDSTPIVGESDRTVESDTNINCTRFLFKNINTYVNTFILLVFYVVVVYLYFFSTLIFNTNVSDTICIGVRLHCPVRFTIHGCSSGILPVNAHIKVSILNLCFVYSFIFYSSAIILSNNVQYI